MVSLSFVVELQGKARDANKSDHLRIKLEFNVVFYGL